ncbi:MAG: nucleotide exchange factor GrpE [Firmicutes bacterium]|nr:nucleotide exchange factor GrpE [Bacillota bacterium]
MSQNGNEQTVEVKDEEVTETVEEVVEEKQEEVSEPSPEAVIQQLSEELAKAKEEIAKMKNDYARAYADTENMKKRLQKEADTTKKYRFQQAGLALLPVMDNMSMALKVQSENQELMNYVKGFEMIYAQLEQVIQSEGIKEVDALNKPFDHNTMQALVQEAVEGVESGIVIEVLQKGYMLKDRILRPALVKVSE